MKSLLLLALALLPLSTAAYAAPEVGKPAPEFMMDDTKGEHVMLSAYKGKTVVLEWTNPDCPFVHKHYDGGNMQALQKEATADGVVWISIDSSAKGKEGNYSADELNKIYADKKANFSNLLIDETGTIGELYGAKTTPHMFVINKDGTLVYAGAIDDKSGTDKEETKTAKNYVRAALSDLKAGKPIETPSTNPYGCGVKY
jgi:peroxiredoxin